MSEEETPLINAAEISGDGESAAIGKAAHTEYGQPMLFEVQPQFVDEDSAQSISTMDTVLRSAFSEMEIPPDSGKRLLQVWARSYGGEPMGEIEQVQLRDWLEENPSVNDAAGLMIEVLSEQFASEPKELMQFFGLGLPQMQFFLKELSIVAGELGYFNE